MKVLAYVFSFLSFTSAALAANWQPLSKGSEFIVYVDTESLVQRGEYWQSWFMWDHDKDKEAPSYPTKLYRSVKALNVFNCALRQNTGIQTVYYSGQQGSGESVHNVSVNIKQASFEDVVPDSIGESMLRYVCSRATHRSKKPPTNSSPTKK